MRQSTLFISILFLPLFCFGQTIISTDYTRILYLGGENKVSVSVVGYSCDDLLLQSATCKVKGDGCNYLITPEILKPAILIIRSKKSNSIIDSVVVPVGKWGSVKVAFRRDTSGSIVNESPILVGDNSPLSEDFFQIIDFDVNIYRGRDSVLYQHHITGSSYDSQTKAAIENAKAGDILWLEEIHILGPDRIIRMVGSVRHVFR